MSKKFVETSGEEAFVDQMIALKDDLKEEYKKIKKPQITYEKYVKNVFQCGFGNIYNVRHMSCIRYIGQMLMDHGVSYSKTKPMIFDLITKSDEEIKEAAANIFKK